MRLFPVNRKHLARASTLLRFELSRWYGSLWAWVALLATVAFGVLVGAGASVSLGPNLFKNSPYIVSIMVGFLSLFAIFFSTMAATFLIFKESDYQFHLIYHALPIRRSDFALSRLSGVFVCSLLGVGMLVLGFGIGQQLPADRSRYTDVQLAAYVVPLLTFGVVNAFVCSALLVSVTWWSRSKMMVYVAGVLLYTCYMVMLIFSGSPLMAKGMPQSEEAVLLSAVLDPFGLSAFFRQTAQWTVEQRNTVLILPSGLFLGNRLGMLLLSGVAAWVAARRFDPEQRSGQRSARAQLLPDDQPSAKPTWRPVIPSLGTSRHYHALLSLVRIDLRYLVSGIPFVLICLGFLFYTGMEMYGDLEQGIRMPQKFARSGLLASTIIDEFHTLCLLAIIFYTNDLCWRSRLNRFQLIEAATPVSEGVILLSKWLTISLLVVFLTALMVGLGLVFQWLYGFLTFDWFAYLGVFGFVSLRLVGATGVMLLVHHVGRHRIAALVVSAIAMLLLATSIGNRLLDHPLLEVLMPFAGKYTDMNGYGPYLGYFLLRAIFALCLTGLVLTGIFWKKSSLTYALIVLFLSIITWAGVQLMAGYVPVDKARDTANAALYEKRFRVFQRLAQPTITNVRTTVDLFPREHRYQINGTYVVQNKTNQPIDSVLVNLPGGFEIVEATWDTARLTSRHSVVKLNQSLKPGDRAKLSFSLRYEWATVNGHESVNAIIENGSFLRLSRFYPQIGYLSDTELAGKEERTRYQLGEPTSIRPLEAPRNLTDDFINLDMTISTDANQTAIGVGELVNHYQRGNRAYFRYRTTSPIPFRFGVSSAAYAIRNAQHHGVAIEVFYHPTHHHNVDHLIANARHTLDYCRTNFGDYPFRTIRFAEVSGFTRGFAATAYPATIFMAENKIFDANIHADRQQDVINELAGHELSHLWWGNNQIAPDEREGEAMLTETLAMYTELMLARKMYGEKRVLEKVNLYLGMYLDERGYTDEQPLDRVRSENVHLSYYKGLVAMYQLSKLLGEKQVNTILRSFLQHHAYPNPRPTTNDLLREIYAHTDPALHPSIEDLFRRITVYDIGISGACLNKQSKSGVALTFDLYARRYHEDGKGRRNEQPFRGTVPIQVVFEGGRTQMIETTPGLQRSLMYRHRPNRLIVDPEHRFINTGSEGDVKL